MARMRAMTMDTRPKPLGYSAEPSVGELSPTGAVTDVLSPGRVGMSRREPSCDCFPVLSAVELGVVLDTVAWDSIPGASTGAVVIAAHLQPSAFSFVYRTATSKCSRLDDEDVVTTEKCQ